MSCCGAHVHEHIDLLSSLHYTSKSDTINIALEYNKGCGFMCDPSCKDQSKKYNKQLDKCFSCNMSNMFAQSNSPNKYVIIRKTKTWGISTKFSMFFMLLCRSCGVLANTLASCCQIFSVIQKSMNIDDFASAQTYSVSTLQKRRLPCVIMNYLERIGPRNWNVSRRKRLNDVDVLESHAKSDEISQTQTLAIPFSNKWTCRSVRTWPRWPCSRVSSYLGQRWISCQTTLPILGEIAAHP